MHEETIGGIIINAGCKNSCFFCNPNPWKATENQIKKEEIAVLKNIQEFKQKKIRQIEISGRDPIEYKLINNLITFLTKEGFNVRLATHGRRLSDKQFLRTFIDSGISELRIPLYGTTAKIHDSICGKGSFDETMKGLQNLQKETHNIKIQITNLICKQNKDNLIQFVDLLQSLAITDAYLSFPLVYNNDFKEIIPAKEMGVYLRPLLAYVREKKIPFKFMDIPFCVFGEYDKERMECTIPPELGTFCQPPERFKTELHNVPQYRLKKYDLICQNCSQNTICSGFNKNEIDYFGTGTLKPL